MKPFNTLHKTLIAPLVYLLTACDSGPAAPAVQAADHVFVNGGVYTVNARQPWAEAVAVSGKLIVFVGDNAGAQEFIGPDTRVTDLDGRMLLPGLGDSHLHLRHGGEITSGCVLLWEDDPMKIARLLQDCADRLADDPTRWLVGTLWARWSFPDGNPPPDFLNKLFPERPVIIEASDGHSYWVNQAALDAAGIDDQTANPANGLIERDAVTGKATGLLHESAMRLAYDAMPPWTLEDQLGFIRRAAGLALEFGITSAIEPGLSLDEAKMFSALDQAGELNMRLLLGLTPIGIKIAAFDDEIFLTTARSTEAESARIRANSVKVFIDGVIENGTAPLLEPYLLESIEPLETFYPPEQLQEFFIRLDSEGFNIHVHAIGDRGIREALDAFAGMRKANGMSDQRHIMTHLQLITEEDIERFAELGIIASFSTLWAYPENYNTEIYPPLVGTERINRFYPVASVLRSGARITIGSDWPIDDLNPFLGIEVALTRQDPYSNDGPALNENERIDLAAAIEAYTLNVAYAMQLENQVGSIEQGKLADLVVLDQNLFEIATADISETRVLETLVDGEVKFERPVADKP